MPRPYKRFLPVFFLKMAADLKKGKRRREIVRELAERHGLNEKTVKDYLNKHFPVSKIKKGESISSLLWNARASRKSPEERSRIARERWEKRSGFVKLRYLEELPVLNLLGKKEIDGYLFSFLKEFSSGRVITDKCGLNVHGWKKYKQHWREDVKQEFVVAVLDALRKWDRKSDLHGLVSDSIVFHLINFFRENKRYRSALRDISPELAELMRERKKR